MFADSATAYSYAGYISTQFHSGLTRVSPAGEKQLRFHATGGTSLGGAALLVQQQPSLAARPI